MKVLHQNELKELSFYTALVTGASRYRCTTVIVIINVTYVTATISQGGAAVMQLSCYEYEGITLYTVFKNLLLHNITFRKFKGKRFVPIR